MTDAAPEPTYAPCANCGLKGGRCFPVEFSYAPTGKAVPGFALECRFCSAATEGHPRKAHAVTAWNEGRVISAFEQARQERWFKAEILRLDLSDGERWRELLVWTSRLRRPAGMAFYSDDFACRSLGWGNDDLTEPTKEKPT